MSKGGNRRSQADSAQKGKNQRYPTNQKLIMRSILIPLGLFAVSTTALSASTVIYSDGFEGLPLNTLLVNTNPWFANNFGVNPNPGEIRLDGPGGVRAAHYPNNSVGWYGGFLRGPNPNVSTAFSPSNTLADISITFWLRGTSSGALGNVGVAILSFEGGTNTGAAYQPVQASSDWTEITLQLDSMGTGIPGHGSEGNAFSLTEITNLQVMFWARDPHETGWPIADEPQWSFAVSDIRVSVIPEPSTYAAIFGVLALLVLVVRRRMRL